MSQEFNKIALTDKINSSISILLKRDETALTLSAGEEEPQDIELGMEGRLCLRTDLKVLKVLTSVTPVVWETLIDFGTDNATKQWVEENYQPVNSNLTALSTVVSESNKIPYFDSANSMSTIDYTPFASNILKAENAEEVRNILELRGLSTVDKITADNVDALVTNASITKDKLAFEPITSEQGYTTGDIKETYIAENEEGWIKLSSGVISIGNINSGATYVGQDYNNLFTKIWSSAAVSFQDSSGGVVSRGNSAASDWTSNKRLILPVAFKGINPNCEYKIKM